MLTSIAALWNTSQRSAMAARAIAPSATSNDVKTPPWLMVSVSQLTPEPYQQDFTRHRW